jgi:hypothetical protein
LTSSAKNTAASQQRKSFTELCAAVPSKGSVCCLFYLR